jgi:hypothetical protein
MNARQELAHLALFATSILVASAALGSLGYLWLISIYN